MRQKRVSHKRTCIKAEAALLSTGLWEVEVYDQAGLLAKTSCVSRSNVASKATSIAALTLGIPEGRIKIDRVTYSDR